MKSLISKPVLLGYESNHRKNTMELLINTLVMLLLAIFPKQVEDAVNCAIEMQNVIRISNISNQ